ncbi:MAG: phosphotriesterase-related protein [Sphingomonadales bacterium]|nr:phosphotriesterase-related protein [Sphingomonadales bacterium]
MAMVQTVRGPIDASALGKVLIHEHIFLMDAEYVLNYRPDFFSEQTIDDAVARLDALKASGIDTIVDLTVLGLGRYIPAVAKVAERTKLNIIVSTGVYTFNDVPQPFQFTGPGLLCDVPEPMLAIFLKDIREGIAGTAIKAGELKCAIDMPGMTKGVERVMRAIAQANVLTGTPITVHTAPQTGSGLLVQDLLASEGVDLRDVVIGHCGDSTDIDYLIKVADRGSLLGMDRFGINFTITAEERVATIAELCRRGYAGSMALGHDCCAWSDFFPSVADYNRVMPQHHYLHIHEDVIPALRAAGASEGDLELMFVANPRRHYEGPAERFAAKR